MAEPKIRMIIDAESVGLHGEAFAVGWTVRQGLAVLDEGYAACNPNNAKGLTKDRAWVRENCPPLIIATGATPFDVRQSFWEKWRHWQLRGATLWADCLYPVESNLLRACIADDPRERQWQGPYPFHEIATVLELAGWNPAARYDRLPDEPEHHPLGDARQSARLLYKALSEIGVE